MRTRRAVCLVAACGGCSIASADLTFEFTKGPGFLALEATDPDTAAAMYASTLAAAGVWSGFFTDPVTLKYTIEYAPASLPPGVLASAGSTYVTTFGFPTVKGALLSDAATPLDGMATGSLPPGPFVPLIRNDVFDTTFPEVEPMFDDDGSPNNLFLDLSMSNAKALGLVPGHTGAAGSDATITVGGASFDFDPGDGIDPGKFDFQGVMMHEICHAMGFVSGTDTMATLFPTPFGPPAMDPDIVAMVTVLDLYRYSMMSSGLGARDISLPIPGAMEPASVRYFSIDGGASPLAFFSTGSYPFAPFGDGAGGGHWKDDSTFGLMDPFLDPGFELTEAWMTLLGSGFAPDIIAMDVIGWNPIPSPGGLGLMGAGVVLAARRRRRGFLDFQS